MSNNIDEYVIELPESVRKYPFSATLRYIMSRYGCDGLQALAICDSPKIEGITFDVVNGDLIFLHDIADKLKEYAAQLSLYIPLDRLSLVVYNPEVNKHIFFVIKVDENIGFESGITLQHRGHGLGVHDE